MLRIRLSRQGSIHRAFYRFVVSDSRKRPSSTALDTLGYYDPTHKPTLLKLDVAKAEEWIRKGAVPTERFQAFLTRMKKKAGAGQAG